MQIVKRDEDCFACDCRELASYCPQLYYNLAEYPREVIPILDDILNMMAQEMRREELGGPGAQGGGEGSQVDGSAATHPGAGGPIINIRPYNLKEPRAIRDLDPNDIEALVQVDGLVTRVSNVMPDMR
jgi:DNA replication licensing factor MCM4